MNFYFCLSHVCQECSDNRDELEAGVRKCKPGECRPDLIEKWEWERAHLKVSSKEKKGDKVIPTRCRSCAHCIDNCEKMEKEQNAWCRVCKNKEVDGNKARQGCKNRKLCVKFLNSEEGKQWIQNDSSIHKRKMEESPVLKQARKIVREEGRPGEILNGDGETSVIAEALGEY